MSSASSTQPPIYSLIEEYYQKKPTFTQHIKEEVPTPTPEPQPEQGIQQLLEKLKLETTPEEVRRLFYFGLPAKQTETKEATSATMPVQPKEEEVQGGSLTDQVAKESNNSTASDHPIHDEAAKAHNSNPGPVSVQDIGKPESKEALKKRADELNK